MLFSIHCLYDIYVLKKQKKKSKKKKKKKKKQRKRNYRHPLPSSDTFLDPGLQTLVCTMRHRLKPSCQNLNNNLTGSSEITLKSLLPVKGHL